jgi:sugar porter (SP) family MFS transporter
MAGYLRRGGYDSPGSSGRSQINTSARTAAALAGLGNRTTQYESKFTWFVLMTALVAASGGLMFGYDNGVSGGVSGMDHFLAKFYPDILARKIANDNSVDRGVGSPYCKFDDQHLQTFTSCLFLAGLLSSFPAAWVTSNRGRKTSMVISGAAYMAGSVILTAAVHISMLYIGRVMLGIGVGFAIQCTTLYNSEMAPARLRGAMNILFQLMVTIGILVSQLINYGTERFFWGWRVSLGIAVIPALILFIGGLTLPETPNSLIERGHLEEGRDVLQRIRGTENIQIEYEDILLATQQAKMIQNGNPYRTLFSREYRPQLVITVLMPFFQQFTGINAVIFYSPILFQSLGTGDKAALESTVIVGAVNVLSTLVAVFGVDRFGRRALLLEAGFQMFVAEVIIAVLLGHYFADSSKLPNSVSIGVIVLFCFFISSFAWSWGPLGWLVPSEIHPLETRSAGQGINVAVNLAFTFLIAQCFVTMLCSMEFGVFLFFAGWVVIMTLFTAFFIPETKGLLIEDVHEVFASHWFWRRVGAVKHSKDIEGRPSLICGVDVLRQPTFTAQDNGTVSHMHKRQQVVPDDKV